MTGINIADPAANTTEGQDLLYVPENIKQEQDMDKDAWSDTGQNMGQDALCTAGQGASTSYEPDMFEDALSTTDMVSEAREEADTQKVRLSEFK